MTKDISSGESIYEYLYEETPSRHLTVVFTLFVFFQIWNMIGSKKINDEINFFDGLSDNPMFIIIWIIIVVG